ncbi:MAG: hypothetical protein A2744_03185 [Candidatus Buchananbacteria bacterium RIFCSPHIGHO2_01_FULL_44_11]|uniref:Queuine tRNA-ribosyltransferase n=1 Tax=Candidatus Buchananbacteria bacterium RIFCSPHIGHO2_01_FULL_44_11 TaxID=1797535 RepID=A0A1G1Y2G3_9BACT|nr:MAG: hypothetical protein A2744_03185 [Candidatus Buchananbacteria bacterium RIFCSPHIGHO2_01_FULL_44_11]
MFKIFKTSKISRARLSELKTAHGKIVGPFFMPIATRAAVKNLTNEELKELNAQIILSNTYHLLLRPGQQLLKKYGGLHQFMGWPGPILTDSGGFQVFSLGSHRQISEKGVSFVDPQNGNKYFLSPEKAIQVQKTIGSDIIMVLDECPAYPCSKLYAQKSLILTSRWAKRSKIEHNKNKNRQLLFGIIQGSVYRDLRIESAKQITKIGFDGYAIGGVAVGEPRQKMPAVLGWVVPNLPEAKPRYLMGVGRPEEIVSAVKAGIDMFDCVIPTREARHGRLYLWSNDLSLRGGHQGPPTKQFDAKRQPERSKGSSKELLRFARNDTWYRTLNINNAKFAKDLSPINDTNLKHYSKAYLHHLFRTNESLGMRLATLNNLGFYLSLMQRIRDSIKAGTL